METGAELGPDQLLRFSTGSQSVMKCDRSVEWVILAEFIGKGASPRGENTCHSVVKCDAETGLRFQFERFGWADSVRNRAPFE